MAQKHSYLETYDVVTDTRTVLAEFDDLIEAPNWSPDGTYLVYNRRGRLYRFDLADGQSTVLDTADLIRCNNDHVLAADGSGIAVSDNTRGDGQSRIYVIPFGGGTPVPVTPLAPSYLHGWSPDGKTLVYCADRMGNYDVYAISANGGEEVRLTVAEGLDDGPEYDSAGEFIWFCSVRSGRMQAWRMKADGSEQTQMTFDENRNTWFPHISPDRRNVVMIAYDADEVKPSDHPADKHVELRLMSANGENVRTICQLFGGQGTINVNSWAPDSRRFAFVSYRE